MKYVWTMDEVHALPKFGGDVGWFYGFVWWNRRLHFGEIIPAYGIAGRWPRRPRELWWALLDVRSTPRRKRRATA